MEELKDLIRDLDRDVKMLARKSRAERVRTIVLAVVVIAMAVYGYLYVHEADARREQVNDAFCYLVSTTPDNPAVPFIHTLRQHFGCPPYSPAKAQQELSPAPTVTVRATRTATATRVQPTTVPGAARTVTDVQPGPTVTRTVTRTATATRTVTRTVSPPSCLQRPIVPCVLQVGK